MERWTPKSESLTLDNITPDSHPLFRYILTRNGHNVALYGGLAQVQADLRDRSARFPLDDWSIVDRWDEGEISAGDPAAIAAFVDQERKAGR